MGWRSLKHPMKRASSEDGGSSLAAFLGTLEIQVLECLWNHPEETSVRRLA